MNKIKNIKIGDIIGIDYILYLNNKKIKLQSISGKIIKISGNIYNNSKTITIMKISKKIGIYITLHINNPNIKKIYIIKKNNKKIR